VWLASLGASTTLVSRVGDDAGGSQLRLALREAGVRCAFTIDPSAATGAVVSLVDERGQRSMLSDRGANARLRGSDLDPAVLAGARHLHLSGYVLLDSSSREAGVAALAAARGAGLSTSVDPQVAAMIDDPAAFVELLRGVDVLLPNAEELAVLGGAAPVLAAVGAIAVTAGAGGASWVDRSGSVSVPAEAVDVVDSTGAGDAFNAGLLVAWLSGAAPRDALLSGVRAGALATTRVGAWPGPSRR
jgi:sugar/nucleoside kinase (ribokinase family)